MSTQYLPRLVALPDGTTIPLVGVTGSLALAAKEEGLPLTALWMEASESYFQP